VAADFLTQDHHGAPGLALAGRAAAVLVHKPNVYMDLSGWSPKYFQPSLVQYANTLIQDKVLFGSTIRL
jgi:predicted TIM-barrel fold metal-dependent hydrolase